MNSTSINLLDRLRRTSTESDWRLFVEIYAPLLFKWSRNTGLSIDDTADLVQDVLLTVIKKIKDFEYEEGKSFRAWLKTIVVNRAVDLQRKNLRAKRDLTHNVRALENVVNEPSFFDEDEYRLLLVYRSLDLLRQSTPAVSFEAAWLQLVEGVHADEVARRLGISLNSVYLAKSRILNRLRLQLDRLID